MFGAKLGVTDAWLPESVPKWANSRNCDLQVLRHLGRILEARIGHHRVFTLSKPHWCLYHSRINFHNCLLYVLHKVAGIQNSRGSSVHVNFSLYLSDGFLSQLAFRKIEWSSHWSHCFSSSMFKIGYDLPKDVNGVSNLFSRMNGLENMAPNTAR